MEDEVREWKVLSWKQKEAIKIALKSNHGKISLRFLEEDIYSDDDKARNAIKKLNNNEFLEKTDVGNKYKIIEEKLPAEVLEQSD